MQAQPLIQQLMLLRMNASNWLTIVKVRDCRTVRLGLIYESLNRTRKLLSNPYLGITYSSGGYKLKRYIKFSSKSGATSWTKGVKWAPNFVPRVEWEARDPTGITDFNHPASTGVIGHHTAGHRCFSKSECMSRVRGIQNYHMDSNNWSDVGYNWLIGDDGRIYEGRGPYRQGAHWSVTHKL